MIEINFTLFVQMAHFLFAWWFLDTFLYKYLVQAVQEEQSVQDSLVVRVAVEGKQLEELRIDQKKRWLRLCSQFRSAIPLLSTRVHVSESFIKKGPVAELSKEETQKTVTAVTQHIVQRIVHE
jgi:hypothetical protein